MQVRILQKTSLFGEGNLWVCSVNCVSDAGGKEGKRQRGKRQKAKGKRQRGNRQEAIGKRGKNKIQILIPHS